MRLQSWADSEDPCRRRLDAVGKMVGHDTVMGYPLMQTTRDSIQDHRCARGRASRTHRLLPIVETPTQSAALSNMHACQEGKTDCTPSQRDRKTNDNKGSDEPAYMDRLSDIRCQCIIKVADGYHDGLAASATRDRSRTYALQGEAPDVKDPWHRFG